VGNQLTIRRTVAAGLALTLTGLAPAQPPGGRADSPAAAALPETVREQSYAPELVAAGERQYSAQCGFCHGLDAAGGSGGPDLTRSTLVAGDFRGDEIIPVIRAGRLDADVPMPAFPALGDEDLEAIVAFIHDQKARAESLEGGRRAVTAEDVQSGDVAAGRRYFERQCTQCHSAGGDLAGIASRIDGLDLMRRMLNPRVGSGPSVRGAPTVVVTTPAGGTYAGLVAYEDEFTIALTDADGRYRSFATRDVDYEVDDPLDRHLELLGEYAEEDLHDVLAYLHTLR
jgi:cytochrome c oxidase cbb3-type subunit 3